jgi:hypothetical protein
MLSMMLAWANIPKPKLLTLDALGLELVPELDHDVATTRQTAYTRCWCGFSCDGHEQAMI